ncbi:hypothetical protein [Neorhizobium sp. NCHU2750]|uniref:ATP dependent DNA ligase n=1 Tax=Neorhizobium sp. NCHU2750 TaxID=1825976 RepID=UPI000E73BAC7|nr:ATP-dependent DNA ligase [Neorhizobium sp. NCHU2750]
MTKVLRSQPLTSRTDAPSRPRPRKALQIEAPQIFHDLGPDDDDRANAPAPPAQSLRGAFFIAGYERAPDAPSEIGTLLLAACQGHDFIHVGSVRPVLNDAEARKLRKMLDTLRWKQKKPPVICEIAKLGGADIFWAYPTLIAEIAFRGFSDGGMVEQATYQGLASRQDNADVFRLESLVQAGQTNSRR